MERVLSVRGGARAWALLAGSWLAQGAMAADDAQPWLLGDWNGHRSALAERGLDMEFLATSDVMAVVDGGRSRGVEALANFDAVFNLDTGTAGWWSNGTFRMHVIGSVGGYPSQRVGDMQFTSNYEAISNTVTFYGLSYEQRMLDDRLGLLVGLHEVNEDFYVTEMSVLFLNSSLGIGIDVTQAGPSTFPVTAPGVRLRLNWTPDTYLLAAVYDGVPGDPDNPYGPQIQFDHGDGVFAIGEAGLLGGEGRYYKVGVGGWYRTSNFDDLDGVPRDENSGIYAIAESDLWRQEDGRGVGVFTQLGFADGDANQVSTYVGGGVNWTGPCACRPADVAGLAVAHARNGDHFMRLDPTVQRAETTIEMTYLVVPTPWLSIQPDLQYVIDPGTDSSLDDALVLGLRVQLAL
ncbi:MAG: carbohydrate porin [Gammaproteobacteria bacterium]